MNENESKNINTENEDPNQINLEDVFPNMTGNVDEDGNLDLSDAEDNKKDEVRDVTVDRDFVPDEQEYVPPTPEFSDNSDASIEKEDQVINIAGPDYSKLFETYKKLFENLTEDVDDINKKFNKFTELIDKNIRETNAIKATQIYSKLFTKLSFGINIILLIAIIILFIIK
jgi:hypothetical protein